jgi:hypothetical protein
VVAGDELAPVQTVVSAAVGLAETDHHEAVVVGEHVLLGAHAHRVPTLHTTVGVHKKFKNTGTSFIKQVKYTYFVSFWYKNYYLFKIFIKFQSGSDAF